MHDSYDLHTVSTIRPTTQAFHRALQIRGHLKEKKEDTEVTLKHRRTAKEKTL